MTMEIEDNTFFLVQLPKGKTLHQSEQDAISHLQANADNLDTESSDVSVVRVVIENDDWMIAEMSWQTIALQLMEE